MFQSEQISNTLTQHPVYYSIHQKEKKDTKRNHNDNGHVAHLQWKLTGRDMSKNIPYHLA